MQPLREWNSGSGLSQFSPVAAVERDTAIAVAPLRPEFGPRSTRRRWLEERRILIIAPLYPPHLGGVERYVQEVSRRVAHRGLDITVLTTDASCRSSYSSWEAGIEVIRVPAWPRRRDYYFAPDIYRIVSSGDWDLIHIQSYQTLVAPLAMLAARRVGCPYVVTFHGGGHSRRLRQLMGRAQWAVLRPLLARATRLVATARFEIELYSERLRVPRDRFALIPAGTAFGHVTLPEQPAERRDPVIASVGRLERYKGHHRLLEALPYILERRPDTRVWIAGSGPYEETLRSLAERLGVSDRTEIRAVPMSEGERMAEELSRVALVVLLSDWETHPSAALEAIALGRPVLVLDGSGLRELADQGLAVAVRRDSTRREIAEAILTQLENPLVPPRTKVASWDDCAEGHIALYLKLLAPSTRRPGAHARS